MNSVRTIKQILKGKRTLEGAGVHLQRVFGYHEIPRLDPFLLLDHFGSDNPDDYIKGFPWHPHRGIETITYMLKGSAEHKDSLGNAGVIQSGDVQWMTAGSGIIHQEMPNGDAHGNMDGFQLWANLPASHKMMEPRYRDITKDQIPEIHPDTGISIKIICGEVDGVKGPTKDIIIDPEYLDVSLDPDALLRHNVSPGYTIFAYIYNGDGYFDDREKEPIGSGKLVIFGDGNEVSIKAGDHGARFLLVSGKPLHEPIAWAGPVVMNTQAELKVAFDEFHNGTFLKHRNISI